LQQNDKPVRFDNVFVSLHAHGRTLQVNDGRWKLTANSRDFPNSEANIGKRLLQVKIDALYDADSDVTAPHGIIGQSYDGDGKALSGAQDDYHVAKEEMSTSAQAEGAIEGHYSEYKMRSPFSTQFKYSRFDVNKAPHRDVLTLAKTAKAPQAVSRSNVATSADQLDGNSVDAATSLDELEVIGSLNADPSLVTRALTNIRKSWSKTYREQQQQHNEDVATAALESPNTPSDELSDAINSIKQGWAAADA